MKGASMALVPANSDVGLGSAVVSPTACRLAMVTGLAPRFTCKERSSCTSWMPSQNDPHVIQALPFLSTMKLGSMAFQLSRSPLEATMHPSSFHPSALASDVLLSNPIADVFLPNVEQE